MRQAASADLQALWRAGHLQACLACLQGEQPPHKCSALARRVAGMAARYDQAQAATADGALHMCKLTKALSRQTCRL